MTSSTAWPEGVIARYATVGSATVDVTDTGVQKRYGSPERTVHAQCTGHNCTHKFTRTGWAWSEGKHDRAEEFAAALHQLNKDAQSHAETCRAMPKPTA